MLFLRLGRIIVAVDPIQRADAVYILGGSRVSRALEGRRLYHEGYAPLIVLSPGGHDPEEITLERQGIHVPNDADVAREVLTKLGVPSDVIVILPGRIDNTAQEVDAIAPLAAARQWTRLIVITDKASTRRAGFAFRRVLGPRVAIIAACTRDDAYDPNRWWAARSSFRLTFYEAPKLFAYWLGLRG